MYINKKLLVLKVIVGPDGEEVGGPPVERIYGTIVKDEENAIVVELENGEQKELAVNPLDLEMVQGNEYRHVGAGKVKWDPDFVYKIKVPTSFDCSDDDCL